ncbi:MAG: DUF4019 domain-containing protein [Burkholderiaceae bacterium]
MANESLSASAAALTWLALVDSGKYRDSWHGLSAFARGAISADDFIQKLADARGPLGRAMSRKLSRSTPMTQLQGAPDGEYVVLEFDSKFANGTALTERVTPVREADGSYRVSGYHLT